MLTIIDIHYVYYILLLRVFSLSLNIIISSVIEKLQGQIGSRQHTIQSVRINNNNDTLWLRTFANIYYTTLHYMIILL